MDLSAYAGQRLSASTLRAATADIMADITALLATIRQETPPAVPWDPAAGGRVSALDRTDDGASAPAGSPGSPGSAGSAGPPGPEEAAGPPDADATAAGQA